MVVEKVFAVIAESTRRDLLEALAQESKSVGQLVDELGVSQPTVSKHLRVLREAGVVTMRAQGQKRYYGINTEPLALVSTWLETLGAGVVATAAAEGNGADGAATADSSEVVTVVTAVTAVTAVSAKPRPAVAPPVVAPPVVAPPVVAPPAPEQETPSQATPAQPAPAQPVPEKVAATVAASHQPEQSPEAPSAVAQSKTDRAPAVSAAAATPRAASNGTAAVVPFGSVQSGVVQANENDGGTPGQFSRSVGNAGRLANRAADLLSNLPALPTFKRRKN